MLSRVDLIDGPVVISGLSVGGDSQINAAMNLEIVLRTMMERKSIRGIWFTDLTDQQAYDRTSHLLDDQGRPTPSGKIIDHLFYTLWRTDIQAKTDELGNVRVRAFPGRYHISSTLADGSVLKSSVLLEKSEETRVILLEPIRPGPALGAGGRQ